MVGFDDDLQRFEAEGALPLPSNARCGRIATGGAQIYYYDFGVSSRVVVLLHGGLGNSRNWGYQVPALVDAGYRVLLIDSRGHGRSSRDEQPFSYRLMASGTFAVMDALGIGSAAFVGWSDGAVTALEAASLHSSRVSGVFFFGCNVDPSGTLPFVFTPVIGRCLNRHRKDYAEFSPAPNAFDELMGALAPMQRSEPGHTASELAAIGVPVTVVQAEHDEFIRPEHARYIADTIPRARFVELKGVSHFAPVQRPDSFTGAVLRFLRTLPALDFVSH